MLFWGILYNNIIIKNPRQNSSGTYLGFCATAGLSQGCLLLLATGTLPNPLSKEYNY